MKKILFFTVFLLFPLFSYQTNTFASTKSREEYEKTGRVIWEVNTKEKLVALTFDDGPHPVFTPQILDKLAKHDAKATFFVAGNKVIRFPDILKQEVKEGHEIANHTFRHIYGKNITSAKLTSELEETDKIIQKIIGFKPSLYRPVGGFYNDLIINTAIKNGKEVVLWSWYQDSRDWANPPVSQICNNITKGVKPGNIILFHDWHGSEFTQTCQTVKALDTILDFLDKNGYKCVTVTELLYRSTQIIPDSFEIYPSKREKSSHIELMF
ncbi:polysaccharide deacetylase family protein [Neobacillus ginsengisoli]|uniref:Peptidoglycan/xylan/chitin deacetylase (PgdA/CDA1 family) n=1 Tax=Neobacillus ginsengisoli TaxID=904295 RepID=A0ABT9XUZ9_9BACI|nr:polysaccharide deacetylase family protein [Neobacillus ginsengisoli]MDQ0199401.1 peptidoglycan/xylan/chitin deacetylase (PgdA/CDA1 family) [Neobacillus ginsengisoli]